MRSPACYETFTQNGDLDFDGTPYWPEWPTARGRRRRFPAASSRRCRQRAPGDTRCTGADRSRASASRLRSGRERVLGAPAQRARAVLSVLEPSGLRELVRTGVRERQLRVRRQRSRGRRPVRHDQQSTLGYPEFLGPLQRNTCGFSATQDVTDWARRRPAPRPRSAAHAVINSVVGSHSESHDGLDDGS